MASGCPVPRAPIENARGRWRGTHEESRLGRAEHREDRTRARAAGHEEERLLRDPCDRLARRKPARAATADALGIPKAYGSYEELLADPEIEAIYNPLPNHLHVPLTLQAAAAGKHVLCEKPIALTRAGGAAAARGGGQGADRGSVHGALPSAVAARARAGARRAHRHAARRADVLRLQQRRSRQHPQQGRHRRRRALRHRLLRDRGRALLPRGRAAARHRAGRPRPDVRHRPADQRAGRFRRRPAPRLHRVHADRAAPARPAVRHARAASRSRSRSTRRRARTTRIFDRRLLVARRHGHRDRDAAGERPVHAAGRSVLARGARRDRAAVRRRGRDRQHARHRCAVPLRAQRALGSRRPR